MRKITGKSIAIPLMAALLAAQSCSKDSPREEKAGAQVSREAGAGNALVTLLPEDPKAGGVLRAVVSGQDGPLRWFRNGEALEAEGDTLPTSGFRKGDVIKVVAGEGAALESAETVLLNTAPSVRSVNISPRPFYRGQDIRAGAEAWDADGDGVSFRYEWHVNGERVFDADGDVLGAGSFSRGDEVAVTVVPSDGESEGEAFTAQAGKAANSAPGFSSSPPADFSGVFIYKPVLSDPDGDAVSVSIERGPEGMTAADGKVEWRPRDEQKGSFEVTIAADDGFGGRALQTFELKVGQ